MCYKQKCKVVSLNLAHPVELSLIKLLQNEQGCNFLPHSVECLRICLNENKHKSSPN